MQISQQHKRRSLSEGDVSVLGLVFTYVIVALLLFFAVGGNMPNPGNTASTLLTTANASNTLAGILYQGVAWTVACLAMAPTLGSIFRGCLELKALTLLSLLAPVSALWSVQPLVSGRRGIFLILATLFAVYLVEKFEAVELAQMLVLTGVVVGLLGIVVSIADPVIGRDARNGGAWQGVFGSKNGCAQYMIFLLSPAVCFRFSKRSMRLLAYSLYFVAAVLIVMAKSKTAWLLCPGFIGLVAWLSQLRKISSKSARLAIFVVVAFAVMVALGLPPPGAYILKLLGKESTLSGRVPLWMGVLTAISKRPLLGYGYDGFWHQGLQGEVLNIYTITHFEVFQAQSGFLEVWLGLGLVGLVLMLLSLLQASRDAMICFRHGDPSSTRWYIGLIVLTVLYNTDESFLALSNSLPWLLYMVACVGLAQEAKKIRARAHLLDLDAASALELQARLQRSLIEAKPGVS